MNDLNRTTEQKRYKLDPDFQELLEMGLKKKQIVLPQETGYSNHPSLPSSVARRRALAMGQLSTGESGDLRKPKLAPDVVQVVSEPPQDTIRKKEDVAVGDIARGAEISGEIDDFAEFDKDGRVVEKIVSDNKPADFEEPIAEAVVKKPDVQLGKNQDRVQSALGGETVQGQGRVVASESPATQLKAEEDLEDGGGQQQFKNLEINKVEPPVIEKEKPVVTIDPPQAVAKAPPVGETPATLVEENQEPEEGAIPINVITTKKAPKTEDVTVYPAGEQREAGVLVANNGVDNKVDEIKNRIFDEQVDSARQEKAQTSIAPAPKIPGNQVPESPEATVTVDGGDVIGEIKQVEKTGEPTAEIPDNQHFNLAVKTTGQEQAGFFANLTKRLVNKKKAA